MMKIKDVDYNFRAFIRFYMDESPENQPERYHELVRVHGKLVPLANVNMKPDTHVKVQVYKMGCALMTSFNIHLNSVFRFL
jgi:hypothetical protein